MQRVSVVAVVVVVLVLGGGGSGGGGGVEAAHRTIRQLFPESSPDCPNNLQCIPVKSCPFFVDLLSSPTSENIRLLRESHCGFGDRGNPLTCCPETGPGNPSEPSSESRPIVSPSKPPTDPPTDPPAQPPIQPPTNEAEWKCVSSDDERTRITFGEDSPLGAYPWIALLGYTSRFQPQVVWGCGGSLINSRYVVTAGHCTAEEFTFNRDLTVIRLGEHDLSQEIDCESRGGKRLCAPPHQSFTPVEIIRHPDFNTRGTVSDDIALIRLDKEVEFNTFVGPVCLPPSTADLAEFLGGRRAFVSGWGATERGPDTQILQQVLVPFVSRDSCNPHYNNALLPEQVCFGGDGRRDSCFGDSGGPVVAPAPGGGPFILLALVSFGQPSCGVEGVPAVYTSIGAYRDWILENVKP